MNSLQTKHPLLNHSEEYVSTPCSAEPGNSWEERHILFVLWRWNDSTHERHDSAVDWAHDHVCSNMKKEWSIEHPSILCFAIACVAVKLYRRSSSLWEGKLLCFIFLGILVRRFFYAFSGPVGLGCCRSFCTIEFVSTILFLDLCFMRRVQKASTIDWTIWNIWFERAPSLCGIFYVLK